MEPRRLTRVAAPVALAVTLAELKSQLRLDAEDTGQDASLMGHIRTAVDRCESFTRRALITQTWTLFMDDWPAARDDGLWEGVRDGADIRTAADAVGIPKPPLQSIAHVKTYDDGDTAATWSSNNYFVDTASEPGRLVARVSQAFPVPTRAANGIAIQYVDGYGDNPADVPQAIRDGLLNAATELYECGGIEQPCRAAEALWRPYRVLRA